MEWIGPDEPDVEGGRGADLAVTGTSCTSARDARPRARPCAGRDRERPGGAKHLKESERRFRLLANTTPASSDVGPERRMHLVNRPWLDFTGGRRPSISAQGGPIDPPRNRPRGHPARSARRHLPELRSARSIAWAGRRSYSLDDGLWSSRIGEDGSLRGWSARSVDLTDERRAREALEIAQTHRIESLGVLAGGSRPRVQQHATP